MAIGAALNKRDQQLVCVAAIAVLLGAGYGYLMYMPKRDQLARVQTHVDSLERRNAQAKADLARGSVEKLRAQAAEYSEHLKVLQQLVPTTNEVPALLENVSTAARRVGLDLASVEPMPVLEGEQFDTYRYKLSVKGGYHDIATFLSNVGSLNRIVAPVAIELKPVPPKDKSRARVREGESLLDTDFQIQTYIARTASVDQSDQEARQ